MIRFNFAINEKSRKDLNELEEVLFEGFVEGFENAMQVVEQEAKQLAPVRTGRLRESIKSGTNITERRMYGWVGSDLIYARLQEEGGIIRPKKGEYLRFQVDGKWRFARQVTIKGQHYLERAVVGRIDSVQKEIESVITRPLTRR
jgi:hypothetical protein